MPRQSAVSLVFFFFFLDCTTGESAHNQLSNWGSIAYCVVSWHESCLEC